METRNITITFDKAKEWYNSGNEALKEAALQAFTEDELKKFDFKSIKTFYDALKVLYPSDVMVNISHIITNMETISKASVASFKLNIIKKALNKGHDMSFDKGDIWFPCNYIMTENSRYNKNSNGIKVGEFRIKNIYYTLLGGHAIYCGDAGLGCFYSYHSISYSHVDVSFLGCATEEIAEHFGKYFAKEIFEAKYGDFIDFKWID